MIAHLAQARTAAGQWGTFEAVYTALFAEAALARARGDQRKLADALALAGLPVAQPAGGFYLWLPVPDPREW